MPLSIDFSMNYTDVHCHLDSFSAEDLRVAIERARKAHVTTIIANGVNFSSNEKTLALTREYPEIQAAFGAYPIEMLSKTSQEKEKLLKQIESHKKEIGAIGEVGLDFKEDETFHTEQRDFFKKIILLAKRLDKPLIVHSRKAEKECINLLHELNAEKVIMHCFSGSMKLVDEIVKNKWFLSIPASVKYNAHFQMVVERVPEEYLLAETDAPYLHPERRPHNEPANVVASYEMIAQIKKKKLSAIEKQFTKNYQRLFE